MSCRWRVALRVCLQVCCLLHEKRVPCAPHREPAVVSELSSVPALPAVTVEGKVYACGEATNGRLGLGMSSGTVPIPRQVPALSSYVVKKVAVHSGTCKPGALQQLSLRGLPCPTPAR